MAVDTLVELTKAKYSCSTRYTAAITKRLSDMTDAELAALEQRMIATAPIVLEATADVSDDAGEQADGDIDAEQDSDGCADDEAAGNST